MACAVDPTRWVPLFVLLGIALLAQSRPAHAEAPLDPVYMPPQVECLSSDGKLWQLATLSEGRIFSWYVVGKAEGDEAAIQNPDIPQKAFGRTSSDGGRTWSEPWLMFEFPRAKGVRLAGVCLCDRDGVLHIFGLDYFTIDVQTADPEKSRCDLFHAMSPDLGKTWSPVQRLDFKHTYTGATNCVLQLSSGRILVPLSYFSARRTGKFISTCVYTDDGGKTWQKSRGDLVVDSGHADIESGACEPVCIELRDGRVWMLIRTQTGYLYESYSSDGGDTWTEPVQTRFVCTNSPGGLLRLRDGRILLVWNNCTFGPYKPFRSDRWVATAAISADDGRTWRGFRDVARMNVSGILGYPFMAETPDGKVLLALGAGSQMLRMDPDWLTATSDKDDFSGGLPAWATAETEGVALADHPDRPGRKVLSLRKTNPEKPAAAVRNFPFGVSGRLDLRLRIEPGFKGARISLNDFASIPALERLGRFYVTIAPSGEVSVPIGDTGLRWFHTYYTASGQEAVAARITPAKWSNLSFIWNCAERRCDVLVNGALVAHIWQVTGPDISEYPPNMADNQRVPDAPGLCYLRLSSTAEGTDEAGMLVESLHVRVAP